LPEVDSKEGKPEFDSLEVVPGFEHQQLQGKVWETATPDELREGLEKAFDYRGDVTLTLKDGRSIEGYIFDRRPGATLEDSSVRLLPKDSGPRLTVRYSEIAGLAFTGRDPAAGKSWEAWVKKYWEKKRAGEKNIELKPEKLD
jgi:hypothetical protein